MLGVYGICKPPGGAQFGHRASGNGHLPAVHQLQQDRAIAAYDLANGAAGNRIHRLLGRIWALLMMVTAIASFGLPGRVMADWLYG